MSGFRRALASVLVLALAPFVIGLAPAQAAAKRPVVTTLSLHTATTAGKVGIVVRGRGFTKVRSVRFGTTRARFTVVSAKKLKVTVPAHPAGTVHVVVTTRAGHSKARKADRFTYVRPAAKSPDLSSWSDHRMPLPANADPTKQSASITKVSCASKHLCAAIGYYRTGGSNHDMASLYADGLWTSFDPEPAGAQGLGIDDVSCAGTTCVIAGSVLLGGHWETFFDVRGNGTWTFTVAPHPADEPDLATQYTEFSSISCYATASCVATGYYLTASSSTAGATWRLDGSTWTAATLPMPGQPGVVEDDVVPTQIACTSSARCVLGGDYSADGEGTGMIAHLSGSTWTTVTAPLPTAGSGIHFNAAACGADGTCLVVGQYSDGSNHQQGLIEKWSGAWTSVKAPVPTEPGADPSAVLESASCTVGAICVVGGSYRDASWTQHALAERYSGGTWVAATPAMPGDADGALSAFHGVSCLRGACAAVGEYEDNAQNQAPAISTTTGTLSSWVPRKPALPADAKPGAATLLSVSCSPDAFCMAVGYYTATPNAPTAPLTSHT